MNNYLSYLESRPRKPFLMRLMLLLVVVGAIDYITGVEVSFSALYLVPVALGAWVLGRRTGVFFSIVSAIVWYLADFMSSPSYSHPLIPYWNALVMLAGFLTTALVLARLKQTIDGENRLAREIQERLLPREIPRVAGYEIAGAWRPAQSVSGDYYDVITLDDDLLAFCVGDVVGHGIPAALLMSNLQAAVRMLAISKLPPREICTQLNKFIFSNTTRDKFITFFYGVLDISKREFVYTNAGHNRPLLMRTNGDRISPSEGGIALGLLPDFGYNQGRVHLEEGDLLLLYTDGVVEARNLRNELFDDERLLNVLEENHTKGATATCNSILQVVSEFSKGIYQDDLTLLALSVQAPDSKWEEMSARQRGSVEETRISIL